MEEAQLSEQDHGQPLDEAKSEGSCTPTNIKPKLEAAPVSKRTGSDNMLMSIQHKRPLYPNRPSYFHLVFTHHLITPEILNHHYQGAGTQEDPYIVDFIENDPWNPLLFSTPKKWCLTFLVSISTLAVAFASSAYSGAVLQVVEEFWPSEEVAILGISLFVLGFALGPLLWGPLSELYGRRLLFITTYGLLAAFNAGAAGSENMATLLVLRFLAGAFGSSPLTNAGGIIADMFTGRKRGVAAALFAVAPFLGPALGPIVGGFVGENIGWRWVEGIVAIFTGTLWIAGLLFMPETYAPLILQKRAQTLSTRTNMVYISRLEVGPQARNTNPRTAFKIALGRPWILLFKEPIVLLLSIYIAILYGTLYMLFAAFPIVYQQHRGWSEGIGGLPFLGVAVGFILAVVYIYWDNKRYERTEDYCISRGDISAPPEARLPPCMFGCIWIPIGIFWFAWTNDPGVHWSISVVATVPFGFGMLLVFISVLNYLIDSYTIYAASVLAANSVLRSLFGAAFPLFTDQMYQNLGIHWASSIPAFLALACVPFPFLFFRFGAAIRRRCAFSKESMDALRQLEQSENPEAFECHDDTGASAFDEAEQEKQHLEGPKRTSTAGPSREYGNDLTTVSTKRSVKSTMSGAQLVLDRARSYASNF